jgi:hypothetical protein
MLLLDLPPEVFDPIIQALVISVKVEKAADYRLVCSLY